MKWLLASLLFIAPLAFAAEAPKTADKPSAAAEGDLWIHDYNEALKLAAKEKKPILILFTGSDWCHYCKLLEKNVLSKQDFKDWAKKNVVLFIADFPQKKKLPAAEAEQNEKLSNEFKIQGYPTIVITDSKGKSQGEPDFDSSGTPAAFIQVMDAMIQAKK